MNGLNLVFFSVFIIVSMEILSLLTIFIGSSLRFISLRINS